MPAATPSNAAAVLAPLSAPRAATYLAATQGNQARAAELYGWNARIAAALMVPTHFAEVTTRNAASDGLSSVYGPLWPWDPTFTGSLPNPSGPVFNPRRELVNVRSRETTTGKVIAELKFVFWQTLFTQRHDVRVWAHHIAALFPNATEAPAALRTRIYGDLEVIRRLRNRIAHHEPIFTRDLVRDRGRILDLVELRSTETAGWVRAIDDSGAVLAERP